jgi:hypothetical protein
VVLTPRLAAWDAVQTPLPLTDACSSAEAGSAAGCKSSSQRMTEVWSAPEPSRASASLQAVRVASSIGETR